MLSIVFLEMTSTLCSFSRVSVKYLSVNNHSLLVVLSSKKDVLLGVEGSGQISCKLRQSHECFSWRQLLYFGMQQKCFMGTSYFIIVNMKEMYTQWWRCNKIVFTASLRAFLSEAGLFYV